MLLGGALPPFCFIKKSLYIYTNIKTFIMQFNLNTEQQDAILYAVSHTLANKSDMSDQTLNNLYDVLDMFKIEENKRYGLYSGTHEGL
jgi:predicted nucleic-acid-binding protein